MKDQLKDRKGNKQMSDVAQQVADDELPSAPIGTGDATTEVVVDGSFDAADLASVPKLGEPIPIGTYHFRCESFSEGENDPSADKPDEARFGKQPYFIPRWVCQQEPHTGRVFGNDFVSWVNQETFAAARSGDKTAQKIIQNRLMAAKDIMEKASYKPTGKSDFKTFLATNPELKIQLSVKERKTYVSAPGGRKLVPTGEMQNNRVKYLPLNRPA